MESLQAILGRIRNEKQDFRTRKVRIVKGWLFNQYETLQLIELYYNSKFESGEFDDQGIKKYFYNINKNPCDVATKEIDVDTRHFLFRPEDGDTLTADIMGKEFRQWVKEQGFAAKLNEYADNLPKYGHIVIKKVRDELHTIDLVNGFIVTNQSAPTLAHTNIIEPHLYSFDDLYLAAERYKWDIGKVRDIVSGAQQFGRSDIEVDERYGWVRESELKPDGSHEKMVYTMAVVAGAEEVERAPDGEKIIEKGSVIYHEEVKANSHPYREHRFFKVPRRWLGLGFVEINFDPQMARNESKYYLRRGMIRFSKKHYVTDDENITRNRMRDADDDEVIKIGQGRSFEPLRNEERNLQAYKVEDNDWDLNVAKNSFSGDRIQGEGSPSETATGVVYSDANIKRFFDRKREDFGIFLRDLTINDIMPLFRKEKYKRHIFNFSSEPSERDRIEKMVIDARLTTIFQNYIELNKKLPPLVEWQAIVNQEKQRLASGDSIGLDIPEAIYDNAKYRLDVVITKENEDTESMIKGREMILTALTANPAILANPITRPLFLEMANLMGVKNLNIPAIDPTQMMMAAQAGGAAGGAPLTPGSSPAKPSASTAPGGRVAAPESVV